MALKFSASNFLRFNCVNGRFFQTSSIKCNAGAVNYLNYEKDPAPEFFNKETQKILFSITRIQLEKIYKKRTVKDNESSYKFLTTKQLEDEVRSRFIQAKQLLQMPPVLKVMEDNCKVISKDPALVGFSKNTFVFTDVTFGLESNDRLIVVRTPDGTLQEAPFEIKKRAWNIYFPTKARSFREPAMFEPDNMKRLLKEHEYEFILDRACTQYEPYEPKFHDITSKVYLHINENFQFEMLRSTRHFGPMTFFFAWHKMIDDLLLDMIRNDFLKNGVQLVCLMYKLNDIKEPIDILQKIGTDEEFEEQIRSTIKSLISHKGSKKVEKSSNDLQIDEACFEFIQDYVSKHSPKKAQLELALQTYKEWHNELKNIAAQSN